MASDSSSSGGSDSEEEEDKADIVTETISTGSGQETIKLTVDAKNEKAVFTRCARTPSGRGLALPWGQPRGGDPFSQGFPGPLPFQTRSARRPV